MIKTKVRTKLNIKKLMPSNIRHTRMSRKKQDKRSDLNKVLTGNLYRGTGWFRQLCSPPFPETNIKLFQFSARIMHNLYTC